MNKAEKKMMWGKPKNYRHSGLSIVQMLEIVPDGTGFSLVFIDRDGLRACSYDHPTVFAAAEHAKAVFGTTQWNYE